MKRGHTKLLIPEQLLLPEADYMKQLLQNEENIAKDVESQLTLTEFEQKIVDEYKVKQSINQGEKLAN